MFTPELEKMYKEAKDRGLWFYSKYASVWFSPDELKKNQETGSFRWGAVNWRLRDPMARLQQLEENLKNAQLQYERFQKRFQESK